MQDILPTLFLLLTFGVFSIVIYRNSPARQHRLETRTHRLSDTWSVSGASSPTAHHGGASTGCHGGHTSTGGDCGGGHSG